MFGPGITPTFICNVSSQPLIPVPITEYVDDTCGVT